MSVIINPSGGGAIASYRVGTLPPGGPIGTMAVVIDGASGQTWASTIAGGGSSRYLVWFNGANWTVVGDGGFIGTIGITTFYWLGF